MMKLEKCLAGEHYDCHDQVFPEMKATAWRLLREYASLAYEQKEEKTEVLRRLFGEIGTNVSVGTPFICDYGRNIHVGSNVSINMNCTFVDCNRIEIGDNTLIASNVQIYTSAHRVELAERLTPGWAPGDDEYFCRAARRDERLARFVSAQPGTRVQSEGKGWECPVSASLAGLAPDVRFRAS